MKSIIINTNWMLFKIYSGLDMVNTCKGKFCPQKNISNQQRNALVLMLSIFFSEKFSYLQYILLDSGKMCNLLMDKIEDHLKYMFPF